MALNKLGKKKNMSNCSVYSDSQLPVLDVRLVGRGEDAIRMDKRLRCAGRALGVTVKVDWQSGQYGSPVIYVENQMLIDHLLETTELEELLQPFIKRA